MILFKLYAIYSDKRFEWRISVNIDVDLAFWHEYGYEELVVIEQGQSIGKAISLLNYLQKQNKSIDSLYDLTNNRQNKKINVIRLKTKDNYGYQKYYLVYQELNAILNPIFQGKALLFDELINFLADDKFKQDITKDISKDELLCYLQIGYLLNRLTISSGVSYPDHQSICNRCGSEENIFVRACKKCNDACAVCEECISLGRSQTCTPLLYFILNNSLFPLQNPRTQMDYLIDNPLTLYQEKIANKSVEFLEANQNKKLLVWAVTGAGKTEMIFPAIDNGLSRGYRILFTAPRRDVIKELSIRFKKAFPDTKIVTLYGGSLERWDEGQLYIATTHQAFRFWHFFDLIIIDEFDAYPFNNQPILQFAVNRALKEAGQIIYMTATPPDEWLKEAKKQLLEVSILPLRHHQQPLPIPSFKLTSKKSRMLRQSKPDQLIMNFVTSVKDQGGQAFIFVPTINDVMLWTSKLQEWFKQETIEGVYANDKMRDAKIDSFRNKGLNFLVTTTIMERGVTISNLHVLVIGANERIFDQSTLIQIAGRAGRSLEYSNGIVLFLGDYKTKAIADAIKHIMWMNKEAKSFQVLN